MCIDVHVRACVRVRVRVRLRVCLSCGVCAFWGGQVRILRERSNTSAANSMYQLKKDFPYSPGRTLQQRNAEIKCVFVYVFVGVRACV